MEKPMDLTLLVFNCQSVPGKSTISEIQVLLVWKEEQDAKVKHMAVLLFQRKKQRGPKDKNRVQGS